MDDSVGTLKRLQRRIVVGSLSRSVLAVGSCFALLLGSVDLEDVVSVVLAAKGLWVNGQLSDPGTCPSFLTTVKTLLLRMQREAPA